MDHPNLDDSGVFTRSERILFEHQRLKAIQVSETDLRDLIRDVLKHSEFNYDGGPQHARETVTYWRIRTLEDGYPGHLAGG